MASNNAKLGIGYASGMFYHAPAGTNLPNYPTEALSQEWKEVGDIAADGITLNTDKTTSVIRNWANEVKRVIQTEHTETIAATIMDTTQEVFETILGEGKTTVIAADTTHGKLIKASITQDSLPDPEAYLFIMKDGDDCIAIGTENGQITAMGAVTFAPGDTIKWVPTITAMNDGWQIILDDGQVT